MTRPAETPSGGHAAGAHAGPGPRLSTVVGGAGTAHPDLWDAGAPTAGAAPLAGGAHAPPRRADGRADDRRGHRRGRRHPGTGGGRGAGDPGHRPGRARQPTSSPRRACSPLRRSTSWWPAASGCAASWTAWGSRSAAAARSCGPGSTTTGGCSTRSPAAGADERGLRSSGCPAPPGHRHHGPAGAHHPADGRRPMTRPCSSAPGRHSR